MKCVFTQQAIVFTMEYLREVSFEMLRIAICDDMPDFLDGTKRQLEQWEDRPENLVIKLFHDGDSLLESHTSNPFDIILLDVIMPLLNGIETAAEIRKFDRIVKIVFLTSSAEYAVDSYTVRANNYLLKPVTQEKLFRCLNELSAEIQDKARSITVSSASAAHRIELRNIEYIEAHGKKVLLVLADGSTIESNNPFYYFQDKLLLEDGFFKCHRSYIINIYRIVTYTQKEIRMQSGFRIPIARSCHAEFEAAYFDLLFREGRY